MESKEIIRFSGTTKYTEEAYNVLAYLMICKLRKWPRMLVILTGCVSVIGSAAMMILQGQASAMGLIVLLIGNILCMFGFFAQRFCVKMMMAGNKKGHVPQNEYLFMDDVMRVRSGEAQKDYSYGYIRRVLEMSGYLFLFTGDGQLYLLSMAGMKGNLKAFRAFLEERITQSRAAKG